VRTLCFRYIARVTFPKEAAGGGAEGFSAVEGGVYKIGFEGYGFCFDNELARHKVYIDQLLRSRTVR
jgi:hypothetical protein